MIAAALSHIASQIRMPLPTKARVSMSLLLVLLLTGCHSRVNEQMAAAYRTTLDGWQMELYEQRRQLDLESAPLLDLEGALEESLGLTWCAQHRKETWFDQHVREYATHLDAWAKSNRECASECEMFIASTDEWLRNLAASHVSRATAEQRWRDYQTTLKDLKQRQQTLGQQFRTDIKPRFLELTNKARRGAPAVVLP
jgi:hypothetical protein